MSTFIFTLTWSLTIMISKDQSHSFKSNPTKVDFKMWWHHRLSNAITLFKCDLSKITTLTSDPPFHFIFTSSSLCSQCQFSMLYKPTFYLPVQLQLWPWLSIMAKLLPTLPINVCPPADTNCRHDSDYKYCATPVLHRGLSTETISTMHSSYEQGLVIRIFSMYSEYLYLD